MAEAEIIYEIKGTTGWITFNRLHARNALTFAMYEGLAEICAGVAADGPLRALVITGAGEKAFAAGTDMRELAAIRTGEDAVAYEAKMDRVMGTIERCPLPVIAALAGACTGGGAALAAASDIRIATADLRFGVPVARTLGNCLSVATLARFTQLIGAGRVAEILLTSRLVGAEEARAIGLVSEVVPDHAALVARATALADQLAGNAPLTIAATKEGLRRLRVNGPGADDHDILARIYLSADFHEGREAFLAKRPPSWIGR